MEKKIGATTASTTNRQTAEVITKVAEGVSRAEPVVEQMGQRWELGGPEVKSTQEWNCAARKMTPRSNTMIRRGCVYLCM